MVVKVSGEVDPTNRCVIDENANFENLKDHVIKYEDFANPTYMVKIKIKTIIYNL